jgi:hypothetical protein
MSQEEIIEDREQRNRFKNNFLCFADHFDHFSDPSCEYQLKTIMKSNDLQAKYALRAQY